MYFILKALQKNKNTINIDHDSGLLILLYFLLLQQLQYTQHVQDKANNCVPVLILLALCNNWNELFARRLCSLNSIKTHFLKDLFKTKFQKLYLI